MAEIYGIRQSIMHSLQWPGEDVLNDKGDVESIIIKSKDNEKYRCLLPKLEQTDQEAFDPREGPDPAVLLSPLLIKKDCSYRIEPYWVYELCHGRFLRQYHEDQVQQPDKPNIVKVTEYYLGHALKQAHAGDVTPLKAPPLVAAEEEPRKVSTLTFDGRVYPYYGISMHGGTPCDLEGKSPRQSVIKYVCKPTSSNEIISLFETTTCEYEVIVQTPLLCGNPAYVPKEEIINNIECHAMDGSPRYPEVMNEYQEAPASSPQETETPTQEVHASGKAQTVDEAVLTAIPNDPTVVKQFLTGEYCLKGGSGWWHFEVCNGRHVKQFHVDRGGRVDIYLGHWDEQVHKDWYEKKITTKKKKSTHYVIHYYDGGDVCDVTHQPRNVQVKLRCLKDASPSRVTVSLEEPLTCQYILTVEAAIICELLETVDEYGMFSPPSE